LTPEAQIYESVDHLFRRHAGQMVSVLARRFGYQYIELIEDAVQDALVTAMKKWPFTGEPENARAWLIETAKNRVIDQLRRDGRNEPIDGIAVPVSPRNVDSIFPGEMAEDELRMIFACCHPSIPPDARVALTLKTVGGFSVGEIARAFLSNNEAVAKMLTRAKAKLREQESGLTVPSQEELLVRRDAVLKVLYLMFNEGYAATEGEELVRKDLCFEAIRLASIVSKHPLTRAPKVNALLALFLFQAARLDTRIDRTGELLLLEDQDRSKWNTPILAEGLKQFRSSAAGEEVSDYHLQAEIAAVHALAADYESTDWERIVDCYDELQRRRFSHVAELNRIVAIEKLRGPYAALNTLESLSALIDLSREPIYHLTRGHLLALAGDNGRAVSEFEAAHQLTTNQPVRRYLQRRIEGTQNRPLSRPASDFPAKIC
jgi:RNA polymerase sigma-70 factor (ECF subfamily)